VGGWVVVRLKWWGGGGNTYGWGWWQQLTIIAKACGTTL